MDPDESLDGELNAAFLYRIVAEHEPEARRKRLFEELARNAEVQAEHWRAELAARGRAHRPFKPSSRARLVAALVRLFGPRHLTHALTAMKVRGMSVYRSVGYRGAITTAGARALPSEHDEIGEHHQDRTAGGSLRAAVFGINDGLISNAGLILGVAGAGTGNTTILLAGIAGLLAGALSMAAGEYISVRSQREMYEHQIALERAELAEYPEEEADELAQIYEAHGMQQAQARQSAAHIINDPKRALDELTRTELGLNPGDLGNPWKAASASFFAFAIGASVPLAPFLFTRSEYALASAVLLSCLGLFLAGAATSLFTGRSALRAGLRMLAIGGAAGLLTFLIGNLLGVSL